MAVMSRRKRGVLGGNARAKSLSAEELTEIGKKGANIRWEKLRKERGVCGNCGQLLPPQATGAVA